MKNLEKAKKLNAVLQYAPVVIVFFFSLSFWREGDITVAALFGLTGIGLMLLGVLLNTMRKIVANDRRAMIISVSLVFCCSLYTWIKGEIYLGIFLTLVGIFMMFNHFLHSQKRMGSKWSAPIWQIYLPVAAILITLGPLLYLQYISKDKTQVREKAVGMREEPIGKSSKPNKVPRAKASASGSSSIQKMVDMMNGILPPDQREDPRVEKLMEIMASDSFQKQVEQQNLKTPADFLQLFAAHGLTEAAEIDFDKTLAEKQEHLEAAYKARNPGKAPEDEDDAMAERFAASMKQHGPMGGMKDFMMNSENATWISFRFKGDPEAYNEWTAQVRSLVETGGQTSRSTSSSESGDFASPSLAPTDVEFPHSLQEDVPRGEHAAQGPFVELEDPTIPAPVTREVTPPIVEPEKAITDVSPEPPALPTEAELEAALREQFSSERFKRAMSTLERYGPEEGLRRLREDDPEVAQQIENSRHAGMERYRDISDGEEDIQ